MRVRLTKRRRIWGGGIAALGLCLLLLGLGLSAAGGVYSYQDTVDGVRLPAVDAIVVLAGGRGRIAAAGDLWNRYRELAARSGVQVPLLYFSGVGPQTTFKSLDQQLRPGVMAELRPDQVVLERESANTEENALWLVRYARERGWRRVLLVTSSYHMKRAQFIFSRILERDAQLRNTLRAEASPRALPMVLETLSVYQDPFEPGRWMLSLHGARVTLEEHLKWLYYSRLWEPALPGF